MPQRSLSLSKSSDLLLLTVSIVDTTLNETLILRYVQVVLETVDANWLAKKMDSYTNRPKPSKLRTHSYLYKKGPHPLVAWAIQVDKWRTKCLESERIELNKDVMKLAEFGRSLSLVRTQKGFERVLGRLKDPRQFHPAVFEIEVAASYVEKEWKVDFVEEGSIRTPDLLVTRTDSSQFWVECKRRDLLTKVEARRQDFWAQLESRLLGKLGPSKMNYLIFIKALAEPEHAQMKELLNFVLRNCTDKGVGTYLPDQPTIKSESDPTGMFQVVIRKLTEPDEEFNACEIGFRAESVDRSAIVAEHRVTDDGTSLCSNPIMLGFSNHNKINRVKGIQSALKSGVGQLPRDGPGVMWIRIADDAWNEDLPGSFEEARALLRKELHRNHNRRVNAVFVVTRLFEKHQKDELTGLYYRPFVMRIDHDNPRCSNKVRETS